MKSVRTSTIWRSLIYQGNDKIFESGSKSAQSAELFLLFVSSASSVVKSRGYFDKAAETFTRAARTRRASCALPRSVESVSSVVVCSFSYSCVFVSTCHAVALAKGGFVVRSENLKKFSLNPVEGISTSDLNVQPSTAESATATTDRTDAQTQKE